MVLGKAHAAIAADRVRRSLSLGSARGRVDDVSRAVDVVSMIAGVGKGAAALAEYREQYRAGREYEAHSPSRSTGGYDGVHHLPSGAPRAGSRGARALSQNAPFADR